MSFADTWMDLETVKESEVSQKEKNKYHTLTRTCGIQGENDIDDIICKAEIETQTQRTNMDTKAGREEGMAYIHYIHLHFPNNQ